MRNKDGVQERRAEVVHVKGGMNTASTGTRFLRIREVSHEEGMRIYPY